jgi:hypothetical protein
MNSKLKFFFCGGSNLAWWEDTKEKYFPYIVSEHFNAECVNVAKPGSSTKRVIRKIFYEYNMEDYDFIFIDFPPESRTEIYNDKWISIRPTNSDNLTQKYYEHVYNSKYGHWCEVIDFYTITKYLKAINKPFLTMKSLDGTKNNNFKYLPYDILPNYPKKPDGHINEQGHQLLAKDIIKYYENIIQRR